MKTAVVVAALALSACGQASTADQIRQALPNQSTVQIGTPQSGSQALTSTQAGSAAAAATPSDLFLATAGLALAVNGGTAALLGLLEGVVAQPPASCSGGSCTWGPGSSVLDVNQYELVVTRNGDAYDYVLSGEPKSRPAVGFVPFLTGTAHPSGTPHVGHGTLSVDFDAEATLDHVAGWTQTSFGTLTVDYDNRTDVVVDATFVGTRDSDPTSSTYGQPANAAYAFQSSAAGGDLQVATRTLVAPATTANLHSRWGTTGAGRGDLEVSNGATTATWSQCWLGDTALFALAYDSTATAPPLDDPSVCAPFTGPPDYGTLTAP